MVHLRSVFYKQYELVRRFASEFVFFFLCVYLYLPTKACRAEKESAGETAGRCLMVLHRIFPEVKVPPPLHAVASRWGSDKWARGSNR